MDTLDPVDKKRNDIQDRCQDDAAKWNAEPVALTQEEEAGKESQANQLQDR